MAVILNEVCGSDEKTTKNIGGKKQCLEGPVETYALATESFSFPDLATAKTKAAWDAATLNKDIVPFPLVESIEANNTEATIRNGRFADVTTKAAVRGSTYRQDLAICTHEAVKSYQNSKYTRIFRMTTLGELTCEVQDDMSVKGEPLTSFNVGVRIEPTDADNAYTNISIKYKKEAFSIIKPDFDITDLEGVYDLMLQQVSASASSIKFTASESCSGIPMTGLETANVVVKNGAGEVQTVSFVAPDADGVYEVTGTGFETGYTVEVDGVVSSGDSFYEGENVLVITVE